MQLGGLMLSVKMMILEILKRYKKIQELMVERDYTPIERNDTSPFPFTRIGCRGG